MSNPMFGVLLHAVGGVAHGTFYAPLHRVRRWAWESYWLVQGLTAWVVTPWLVATMLGTRPLQVLGRCQMRDMLLTYGFGAMWGFGSLTFGLTMRYLGMSLGMAVALGFCATFGTLIPPLMSGQLPKLTGTTGGLMVLGGVLVCLTGIGLCGQAGMRKERELTDEQKKAGIREFALGKGFLVAVFSGIMSAGFAYGINAGKPIAELARQAGASDIFKNSPVFIVVMAGGFTVNFIWCLLLNARNRSFADYVRGPGGGQAANYALSAAAGIIWYSGFFFYGMGTTMMGTYDFSSWSIHMAFVIVFSTLCGIALKEWAGVRSRTGWLVAAAIVVLIASTVVTGLGNHLASR